jgi:hypothetical protein
VQYPARRERGAQHRARRGHRGATGTIEGDGRARFPVLPRERHPASGHPLPDMPPHHRLPAREGQRCPDRALPPGPPRNAPPPLLPVASHTQIAHRPQRPLPGKGQQDHVTHPRRSPATASPPGGHTRYPPRRGDAPSCGDQPGCAHQADLVRQAVPGNIRICVMSGCVPGPALTCGNQRAARLWPAERPRPRRSQDQETSRRHGMLGRHVMDVAEQLDPDWRQRTDGQRLLDHSTQPRRARRQGQSLACRAS